MSITKGFVGIWDNAGYGRSCRLYVCGHNYHRRLHIHPKLLCGYGNSIYLEYDDSTTIPPLNPNRITGEGILDRIDSVIEKEVSYALRSDYDRLSQTLAHGDYRKG